MEYLIGNSLINSNYGEENHLCSALIGGGAASGKTQFIQKFIQDTIRLNDNANMKFLIVDPKGDFSWDNIIPQKYLYSDNTIRFKTNNNDEKNKEIFNIYVKEEIENLIKKRQILFQRFGVSNYYDYNHKENTINLPIIYLIIDELMTIAHYFNYDEDFKDIISKWIIKCRSVGIIPIYISHRFTRVLDFNIIQLSALRVCLRTNIILPELFNKEEIKYIKDNNLENDEKIAGEFIAKLGESHSGWIKYKYNEI